MEAISRVVKKQNNKKKQKSCIAYFERGESGKTTVAPPQSREATVSNIAAEAKTTTTSQLRHRALVR